MVNLQTGTSYIVLQSDNNRIIEFSSANPKTCYLPSNVTKAQITFVNTGVGTLTISASTGVTLYSRDSSTKIKDRYGAASAYTITGTPWILFGDLT